MHTGAMQPSEQGIEPIIRTLLGFFGVSYEADSITVGQTEGRLAVSVTVPEGKVLIGKGGQNLKALEHVLRLMWGRQRPDEARGLVLDVNGYRQEVAAELATNVREIALRVRETRSPEALRPMTSYERRIVHTELATFSDLASESVGQEPHRRVVIRPL